MNGSSNTPRRNLHRIIESITAARSSVSTAAATWASPPCEAVELAGQVGLVGAGAVVVGAAGVDRQPERHRLQRARLVAGQLQALDLRREVDRAAARPRSAARREPSREQLAQALRARADRVERPQQRRAVAEPQPRLVDQPALGALHRPRDGAAGRDRVDAQLVAAGAGGEHVVGVGHAAQRAEGEHVLVLHPLAAAALAGVDVLAADRAGRAAVAGHPAQLVQLLGRQLGAPSKVAAVKLRVGSVRDRVERQQVGQRAQLAVLRGRRAEAARAQVLGRGQHRRRVGHGHLGAGLDQHGLDVLGPEHRAEPAAAGMAAVVADRRVPDTALAGRADRRRAPAAAEPLPQPPPRPRRRGSPASSGAGSSRTPSPSIEQHRQLRRRGRGSTIASCPVSLPAMANWLDASASVSSPVSGDLATTANFALVVSGVPTSGENTNASGASGPADRRRGGASRCSSQVPSPTPPR